MDKMDTDFTQYKGDIGIKLKVSVLLQKILSQYRHD